MPEDDQPKECARNTQKPALLSRDDPGQDPAKRGRRRVIKSALAGGGAAVVAHALPSQWKKPVIDSVVLPAHAQTSSDSSDSGASESSSNPLCELSGNNLITFAATRPSTIPGSYTIENISSETYSILSAGVSVPVGSGTNGTFDPSLPGMSLEPGDTINFDINWVASFECTAENVPGTVLVQVGAGEFCSFSVSLDCASTSNTGNAGNASDIRLKTGIERLAVSPNGHQLYRFRYKDDPLKKTHVGLMAQDLISSHPHALRRRADGYFMVRYDLLGLRMTSLDEWNQSGLDSVLLPN